MRKMSSGLTRRDLLRQSAAGAVLAAPWFVPAAALGREGKTAPSERITLGVIGVGPRCTYDLRAMLQQPDVQCVAVCDVQASRRETAQEARGRRITRTKDCATYRDFHELLGRRDIDAVLIATGDRWHAAGLDPGRAGRQGHLQRKALRPDHRLVPGPRRHDPPDEARLPGRHAAAQRGQLPGSGAAGPQRQARQAAHAVRLRLYALESRPPGCPASRRRRATWWTGTSGWGRPRGGLTTRTTSRATGAATGTSTPGARLLDWGAHTVDLCQWANKADDTMPVEYEPSATQITARYANGVKLVLDFLKTPFGERPGWVQSLGTCPVRFVGDEGSVEVGRQRRHRGQARVAQAGS